MQTVSVITCPRCGFSKEETMPTDSCQIVYTCAACGAVLRPKPNDCCVFCSYGSVQCPPMQIVPSEEFSRIHMRQHPFRK